MKRVFLILLLAFGLVATQAKTCEVSANEVCENYVSTDLNDTILADGIYEIDARWTFLVTIKNGQVVSFVDKDSKIDLVSQLVSLKFFSNAREQDGFKNFGMWAEQHRFPYAEMARTRKLGTEAWTCWAVIIGNMKRTSQWQTSDNK